MEAQSPDAYDENSEDQAEPWDNDIKHETHSHTSPSGNLGGQPHSKPHIPMQKRRRVTRACDECRRKKIKCDGKQPCTHCTVYSYECTYDQPSNRRRNPAPQYIEGLEHRVHRAETLLHMLMPDLNLNDPSIDVAVAQGYIPGLNGQSRPASAPKSRPLTTQPETTDAKDTDLESMVRAIGQLELDEQGYWDYHGHSSGLSFVRRMREQLGDVMGPDTKATPFAKSRPMSQIFDSPRSTNAESPMESYSPGSELPLEHVARDLCSTSISHASILMRIVHVPSFWKAFDRLFSTPYENFTNEDHRFMPLMYSVMAVGCVHGNHEKSVNQGGYEPAINQGFKYFKAARQLLDIADCRDLTSIQAVIYMILFLQSSAKLSQCYAYVGVALRSALRMGLHRSHRSFSRTFNPVEAETRKRVFWNVRKMDIYIGAMLGLPQTLSDEDIDQDLPVEVDDEYITEAGILPMPEGTTSLMTAFNAHCKLVKLLTKIVRNVYPIRAKDKQCSTDKSYTVPFSVIRDIEKDLEEWKDNLPPGLDPSKDSNPKITKSVLTARDAATKKIADTLQRAQQLLRIAYAHTQAMLYRPFLHFVATDKRGQNIDQRAYTCAASFVNLSRNIIHLCAQMKQNGILNGAQWFIMYTTFFSVMSLIYFAVENPENPTTEAVMKDALQGREVLASLAIRSLAADRCAVTLEGVFNGLPDWLREGRQNPIATKKRRQSSMPQPARNHPNIAAAAHEPLQKGLQKRAETFPKKSAALPTLQTSAFDGRMSFAAPAQSGGSMNGSLPSPNPSLVQGPYATSRADDTSPGGLMPYLGADLNHTNLPDLSAMMFPSAEPFNYPNQPLTTFENNQFSKDASMYNSFGANGTTAASVMPSNQLNTSESDNLEAQFYPLPPYMMAQPQQMQQQQQQQIRHPASWDVCMQPQMNGMPQVSGPLGMDAKMVASADGWNGQQPGMTSSNPAFTGVNLNDIFGGEEWNGMLMDQGFGRQ